MAFQVLPALSKRFMSIPDGYKRIQGKFHLLRLVIEILQIFMLEGGGKVAISIKHIWNESKGNKVNRMMFRNYVILILQFPPSYPLNVEKRCPNFLELVHKPTQMPC